MRHWRSTSPSTLICSRPGISSWPGRRARSVRTKRCAARIWGIKDRDGIAAATARRRARYRGDLRGDGARGGDDLSGDRPSQFRARRNGDVLDLSRLADHPVGAALLGRLYRRDRFVLRRRHRHRAGFVQADPQRPDPQPARGLYRALQHPQQFRRRDLGFHDQDVSDPVWHGSAVRPKPDQHPPSRDDRGHLGDAGAALSLFPRLAPRARHARRRGKPGIGAPGRHPRRLDAGARLGHVGSGRCGRRHADRSGGVPRAEHDAGRSALRLRRRRPRRPVEPRRRGRRRFCRWGHREPRGFLHSLCRPRIEADDRPRPDRRGADGQTERRLRASGGEPGMTMPPQQTVLLTRETPRAAAIARLNPRHFAIGVAIVVALLLPLLTSSFITFQLTLVMIYGLAILGLNLLTGFNGQFSLGHSAFYGIGAYTAAILMDQADLAYYWTLPCAGALCFVVGFLFGLPALRLQGLYLALATFALATAMPQILKFHPLEPLTGGVQGISILKPDPPAGVPLTADQWLYYFTLAVLLVMFAGAANLLKSRTGRAIMAIRDHPLAAAAMGINTALYKTLTFGVSALYTGVAGALGAIAVQFVAPDSFTFLLSVSLLVGLVIGGVGSIPGSLFGGVFVLFVPNIAERVSTGLAGAIYGVILLLVIFVMPSGAAGFARRAVARLAFTRTAHTKGRLS